LIFIPGASAAPFNCRAQKEVAWALVPPRQKLADQKSS
jgi:hypothetical protein